MKTKQNETITLYCHIPYVCMYVRRFSWHKHQYMSIASTMNLGHHTEEPRNIPSPFSSPHPHPLTILHHPLTTPHHTLTIPSTLHHTFHTILPHTTPQPHHPLRSDRPLHNGSILTCLWMSFFHSWPSEMAVYHFLQTSSAWLSDFASRKERIYPAKLGRPWPTSHAKREKGRGEMWHVAKGQWEGEE